MNLLKLNSERYFWSNRKERKVNALAHGADEGRKQTKATVSCNKLNRRYPNGETHMMMNHVLYSEYIAIWRETRRTETSKYPEEKKENSIS